MSISMRLLPLIVCMTMALAAFFDLALAEGRKLVPERFEYTMFWGGINVGTSSLEVRASEHGSGYLIHTDAYSNDWLSKIYTVEDHALSFFADLEDPLPDRYILETREGRSRKHRDIVFLPCDRSALYMDHIKGTQQELPVPERAYDPLSAFYKVRWMPLVVGTSLQVPLFESKKFWTLEVKVLRKESVTVPAGIFNTVVISPMMQSEGIFSRKGDMLIWLTDDERRRPVKLKSKVTVGTVDAELSGGAY